MGGTGSRQWWTLETGLVWGTLCWGGQGYRVEVEWRGLGNCGGLGEVGIAGWDGYGGTGTDRGIWAGWGNRGQHGAGAWGTGCPAPAPHPIAQLTSPLQDHPHSADGHAPDPASGQGSQCDSPKQAAGQESPPLPVPSAVKVMPVPPGSSGEGLKCPCAAPHMCGRSGGFDLKAWNSAGRQTLLTKTAIWLIL